MNTRASPFADSFAGSAPNSKGNKREVASEKAEEIRSLMTEARTRTLSVFDMVRESDLHQSPGFGFRPIIWHLAHIGVFESYWLLQKLRGEKATDERYQRIFDPISTPREESKELPSRSEMEAYLKGVRERVWRVLDQLEFDELDPLLREAYIFELVLQHEYQHQETLAYLFHLLDPAKKMRPGGIETQQAGIGDMDTQGISEAMRPLPNEMLTVAEGDFVMGAVWDSFSYDNELPAHRVHVPAFKIDRLLTTNAEYLRFVEEGGYERREWWSDEGWAAREREGWTSPLYWSSDAEGWRERTMFDDAPLKPCHPVTGVSWYEAEAYARFMRKRLPTETEWEKAASWDEAKGVKRRYSFGDEITKDAPCNFDLRFWGTTAVGSFPKGASPCGCLDMTGNVWEWTSDAFVGYTGFEPFPYREYSEEWFDGDHRVLRGGSWATRPPLLRTSFRNFFRRPFRIAFAGIRLAEDL